MSEHHPPSNSHAETKEDISLPISQENQPVSTTLQSIMAAPFDSSLPQVSGAAEPKKDLNPAEHPMVNDDDDSCGTDTDQSKGLVTTSAQWKGKGKATVADHTRSEQEMITARSSSTPSTTVYDMPPETYENKKETGKLATHEMADGASGRQKELPTEIWTKIWTLVANNNPRNLDIWPWSLGLGMLWNNKEQQTEEYHSPYGCGVQCQPIKFITTQVIPLILHVSVLSRGIGLKYYKLGFGCSIKTPVSGCKISLDYSRFEPRIYYHVEDDLICPMGRFDSHSSKCFWEEFPEELSAVALNLSIDMSSGPRSYEEIEEYSNEIARGQFGDEGWRGTDRDPHPFEILTHSEKNLHVEKFLGRVSKIYLYNFTDYICERGPRDFRFTPFVESPTDTAPVKFLKYSTMCLFEIAEASLRSEEQLDLYDQWEDWLRYGGLTWLKDGGPEPCGIQVDNPTAYDLERNEFFRTLKPWEVQEFKKRGVPNIGFDSKFSIPGIPEIHFMNLEFHR